MRGGADFRRGNVEHDLDDNDEQDIEETLFRLPNVAMTKKKSGPRTDNSHDAAGRTNDLGRMHNFEQREQDNAAGGSDTGEQVTGGKSQCANGSFQWRTQHIEREKIEDQMKQAVMEKERGKEPPKFAFVDNGEEIERAQSMQCNRIVQRSSMELDIKCAKVE